ncbi:hypothetical protein AB0941_34505 [Streptomyces sp. NPDC013433]|uniref:hypothetical protein n=1 Tax=Streptomyces sp. NPDC013433 TaxID=3155604 RepID=UPI0034522C9D
MARLDEDGAGTWPPHFPDPEDSPFTDAATDPDSGAGERNQGRRETSESDTTPPHFRDTSHSRRRPAAPPAWDEDDEYGS